MMYYDCVFVVYVVFCVYFCCFIVFRVRYKSKPKLYANRIIGVFTFLLSKLIFYDSYFNTKNNTVDNMYWLQAVALCTFSLFTQYQYLEIWKYL